jgi:hypothetical protein
VENAVSLWSIRLLIAFVAKSGMGNSAISLIGGRNPPPPVPMSSGFGYSADASEPAGNLHHRERILETGDAGAQADHLFEKTTGEIHRELGWVWTSPPPPRAACRPSFSAFRKLVRLAHRNLLY